MTHTSATTATATVYGSDVLVKGLLLSSVCVVIRL